MGIVKWLKKFRQSDAFPYVAGTVIIGILLLFLTKLVASVLVLAAAIGATILVKMLGWRQTGFELVTFATVLYGMVYGPKVGGTVGGLLILWQLIVGGYISAYVLWVVPGYIGAGIIAGLVGGTNIAGVGIAITISLNFFNLVCTALFTPPRIAKYLPYAIMNAVINFLLFTLVGSQVLNAMT